MGTSYPSPVIPPEEYLARGQVTALANAYKSHRPIYMPSQDESGVSLYRWFCNDSLREQALVRELAEESGVEVEPPEDPPSMTLRVGLVELDL